MPRINNKTGFTLLEILVALSIMAFGLAALWKGLSQTILLTERLPERVVARWVAQNRLVLRQAQSEWPATRTFTGVEKMDGRKWYWHEIIEKTEHPLMRRIVVEVSIEEKSSSIYRLEGYVSRPRVSSSS